MIRPITSDDREDIISLIKAVGLFESDEVIEIAGMLSEHLSDSSNNRDLWFTENGEGKLVSVAYVAPERMTEGTWNLYLIAVHPNYQKQGHGVALLHHIEQTLAIQGARVLLVETMSLDEFSYVRAFYNKNGFVEEARIREFYAAGADKVIFWKALS